MGDLPPDDRVRGLLDTSLRMRDELCRLAELTAVIERDTAAARGRMADGYRRIASLGGPHEAYYLRRAARLDELAARSLRVAEYEYEQIAYFRQAFTDQAGGTSTAAWPTITG